MPEIVKKDLKQRDTEAYFKALRKYYEKGMTDNEIFGASVRAGVESGLISGATVESVGELRPFEVEKLSEELSEAVDASRKELPS